MALSETVVSDSPYNRLDSGAIGTSAGQIFLVDDQDRAEAGRSGGNDCPIDEARRRQRFAGNDDAEDVEVGPDDMDAAPGIHARQFGFPSEAGKNVVPDRHPVADHVPGTAFHPDHPSDIAFGKQHLDRHPVVGDEQPFFAGTGRRHCLQNSPSSRIFSARVRYSLVASFRPMNISMEPVRASKTRVTAGRCSRVLALSTMAARAHW